MKSGVLYQWEIIPEEKKYGNIGVFPLWIILVLLFIIFIIAIFFETTGNNPPLFLYILDLLTNQGWWSKLLGMFLALLILLLFWAIVGTIFAFSRRTHSHYQERYAIRSLGITIISHDNIAKNHLWSSFKGFFKMYSFAGWPTFYLVNKGAIMTFPHSFYPSVMIHGKEENMEQINNLLSRFIPPISEQELRRRWYITVAFFIIINFAGGLIIGFIAKKLNLI